MDLYLNRYLYKAPNDADFYRLSEEEKYALKKCLLGIYKDINDVCKKYNLTVMLSGGSALGAVRHKGFIPWDDDIDLMMPREDYNKLLKVIDKEIGNNYTIISPYSSDVKYIVMLVMKKNTIMRTFNDSNKNISGIKIDIFPIEKTPDNVIARWFMCLTVNVFIIIIKLVSKYRQKNPKLKEIISRTSSGFIIYHLIMFSGRICSIIPDRLWHRWLDRLLSSAKGKKYLTIATGRGSYKGELLPHDVFLPVSKGSFEGMEVNLPHNPDIYLSNLYGNYMELPAVEKREQHDCFEFCLDTTK
jgi:lipopolysaccharide cholinephosphotransferase